MAEILLVNPRKRANTGRRKKTVKKRRTAAQKAATRKMIAANRRRKNPASRKRVTRRRKPSRAKATTRRRRRAAPVARRRRSSRRRSNPALSMRSVQNQLTDAGVGALGALGLDVVQGYLPIPANLKGGLIGTGVKALLAIGIGVVASKTKFVKSSTAARLSNGALIVVLHDELRKQVGNFAPGLQLGEYMGDDNLGYYGSGYKAGVMDDDYGGVGSYLPDMTVSMEQDGFGEYMGESEYIEDMAYT